MQEYWFCAVCKSMNRGTVDRCYSCKAPREGYTMATVAQRSPDVVLTPGLDDEHRQVAWQLMRNGYISSWRLGYVAAGLLLAAALALVALVVAQLVAMRQLGTIYLVPEEGMSAPVLATATVFVVVGLVTVVVHSVFLGLTSAYTAALGSGSPRFDPIRAALWWIESALWAIRAALAFVVPPFLMVLGLFLGGLVFGVIGGLVWLVCALWVLGDPISALTKPARLLKDLYDRLAGPTSPDSRIVGYWTLAWGTARGLDFAVVGIVYIVFLLAVALDFVMTLLARLGGSSEPMTGISMNVNDPGYTLLGDLVLVVQIAADVAALVLLAQITIELSRRQHLRERWVMSGLVGPGARPIGPLPSAPAAFTPPPPAPAPPQAPTDRTKVASLPRLDNAGPASTSEPAAVSDASNPPAPSGPAFDLVAGEKKVIRPSSSTLHRYGPTRGGDDRSEPSR